MIFNDIGKIANEYWIQIPKHFPNLILHEYVIMPNHVHGIIELKNTGGTRHGVSPQNTMSPQNNTMSQQEKISVSNTNTIINIVSKNNQFSVPIAGSISVIINQYKSSVKRWCNKNNGKYFRWQSRFYEHIIRNEQSYQTISGYIINNPVKWKDSKFIMR